MITTLVNYVLTLLGWLLMGVWYFIKARPGAAVLIALAIIRSFGTVVQSGQAAVLFSWGRARKVLEPGFHPLIPIVQTVRKVPVRSVTLDLPRQRLANGDGLVYDVDTSIVFRVEDPIKALTRVDSLMRGLANVVPLVVHELLREQTGAQLTDRQALDAELTERCKARLAAWGLTVEQAGFSSIAPTRRTIRLSQLRARVAERRRLMRQLEGSGPGQAVAVLLAAAGPPPVGHAAARYRRERRLRLLRRRLLDVPKPEAPVTLGEDKPAPEAPPRPA